MDGPPGFRRPSRQQVTKILKESVKTGHPTGLPERLLRLFAPNKPLEPAIQKPHKRPALPYTGVAQYVENFAEPGTEEYEPPRPADAPSSPRLYRNREFAAQVRLDKETKEEKANMLRDWRNSKAKREVEDKAAEYDPNTDPAVEGDPYKTLFVARLSYEVTERRLATEFGEFGPIKHIRVVHDKVSGKPRGYAFIEYEHKKDMKEAYKAANGRKLEGRRILVDVERGRTVENWRPMRLAGGLGGDSRAPKESKRKLLAAAVAAGLPPPVDERAAFRPEDRGPPRDMDRGGGPDWRGGGGGDRFDRGPPNRGGGGGGPGYDRDRERDRDFRDRDRDSFRDRERGPPPRDYRAGDRRPRDASPRRDDYKRRHVEGDQRRGY